jgi:hypothetical protein
MFKEYRGVDFMASFGRFELGKNKPSETYEGDRLELEKGYVKIIKCEPGLMELQTGQVVAVIHLDKGQSVRKIGTSPRRN